MAQVTTLKFPELTHCIYATHRETGVKQIVSSPLTEEQASNWKPTKQVQQFFKYFNVKRRDDVCGTP